MRALNKGWIGIALVILFGLSLFLFRGSSRYSNLFNSDNFVANISGTPISTTQFLRSLEMNIGQFAQMIGEDLSGDQIRAFQIHQLVLQNLVNNAIFENEFENIDFILDKSTIARKTKQRFPNLYNAKNQINDEALNSFLRQQRLKIEDLVNIIHYETRAVVFDNLLFERNYPKEFSNKINLFNEQTRKINLLKIPYENIILPNFESSEINKNNSELIKYFEDNSFNYMSDERRDISYIVINKDSFKKNYIPDENEVLEYFNNNKKIFDIPEKRSFKQFNFKSKIEAEDFKLKISGLSNEEIIEYAKENNIKLNNFENVNNSQVLTELSEEIFSLYKGELSEIIETTLAHHLIILDEISPKRESKLSEVDEEIKTTLTNVKLNNFYNDLKLKINEQILNGFSMKEISIENNLSLIEIDETIQNTEEKDELRSAISVAAFSQNKDFISDILDFNDNISFIVNVREIYPSKIKKIDEVFNNLLIDFIKFKKLNFAQDQFEISKNDRNLDKINKIYKQEIEEINLNINSENISTKLLNNIFKAEINSITFSSDENHVYFASIKDIKIPDKTNTSDKINLLSELKNAFGNEIIKTKNISINDELINGLLSQYK